MNCELTCRVIYRMLTWVSRCGAFNGVSTDEVAAASGDVLAATIREATKGASVGTMRGTMRGALT
jgi:hypothetical protein